MPGQSTQSIPYFRRKDGFQPPLTKGTALFSSRLFCPVLRPEGKLLTNYSLLGGRLREMILSGLHTANLSWQTPVGKLKLVCVSGIKTVGKHFSIWRQQFANVFAACFCAVHTHQLGFANLRLPCEGRFRPH